MSKDMLVLELACPHCQAVLTEGKRVHLDAYVKDTQEDGELYLSAIFGDYSIDTDLKIPDNAVTEFRCPRCDSSLTLATACNLCRAPMASLTITSGGYLEFCSRKGCKSHALGGFGDIDQMMGLMNKMFNTPHD